MITIWVFCLVYFFLKFIVSPFHSHFQSLVHEFILAIFCDQFLPPSVAYWGVFLCLTYEIEELGTCYLLSNCFGFAFSCRYSRPTYVLFAGGNCCYLTMRGHMTKTVHPHNLPPPGGREASESQSVVTDLWTNSRILSNTGPQHGRTGFSLQVLSWVLLLLLENSDTLICASC